MSPFAPFPEKTKAMDLAVQAVRNGVGKKEAAKAHGLRYRSLLNRLAKERADPEMPCLAVPFFGFGGV